MINKLYKLFSSGIAELNQIHSDCETLIGILTKFENNTDKIPMDNIKKEIDNFKMRINNIYDVDLKDDENYLYDLINIINTYTYNDISLIISGLFILMDKIYPYIVKYSKLYLDNIGINI